MERKQRFVTLVQFVLLHSLFHPIESWRKQPDLYDMVHCLDDAYFYARSRPDRINVQNLASEAQGFCSRWMAGDPKCKRF